MGTFPALGGTSVVAGETCSWSCPPRHTGGRHRQRGARPTAPKPTLGRLPPTRATASPRRGLARVTDCSAFSCARNFLQQILPSDALFNQMSFSAFLI